MPEKSTDYIDHEPSNNINDERDGPTAYFDYVDLWQTHRSTDVESANEKKQVNPPTAMPFTSLFNIPEFRAEIESNEDIPNTSHLPRATAFVRVPKGLSAKSANRDILRYVKKLRLRHETHWWDQALNPYTHHFDRELQNTIALFGRTEQQKKVIPKKKRRLSNPHDLGRQHTKRLRPSDTVSKVKQQSKNMNQKHVHQRLPERPARQSHWPGQYTELVAGVDQLTIESPTKPGFTSTVPKGRPIDSSSSSSSSSAAENEGGESTAKGKTVEGGGQKTREYGNSRRSLKGTMNCLNILDVLMFKATFTVYRCDGKSTMPRSTRPFPLVDMKDFTRRLEEGRSATGVCKDLGWKIVAAKDIVELPNIPFKIVDVNNIPIFINLPGFFSKELDNANEALIDFGLKAGLKQVQADAKGRGKKCTYARNKNPSGCINLAAYWVPIGRSNDEQSPSAHMINGGMSPVNGFKTVQEHLDKMRRVHVLANYALRMMDEPSYIQHLKAKHRIQQKIPSARAFGPNYPSLMSGHSCIYNRHTDLHFDNKEAGAAWAQLLVFGTCTTGHLSISHLGFKVKYLPTNLVFLRGRSLAHSVTGWDGEGDRICLAGFNHQSEWKAGGIKPVFSA